jgi:hypothetical protein
MALALSSRPAPEAWGSPRAAACADGTSPYPTRPPRPAATSGTRARAPPSAAPGRRRAGAGRERRPRPRARPGRTARPGSRAPCRLPGAPRGLPRPGRARRRGSGWRCGSTRRGQRHRDWPRTDHMESRTSLPVLSRESRSCADVDSRADFARGAGIGLSMTLVQVVDSVNGRGRHCLRARGAGGWSQPFHVFHQACPQAR